MTPERRDAEYRAIVAELARTYWTTPAEILSTRRTANVANARHTLAWILRHHQHLTYEAIGRRLRRDHTTVIYGVKRIEQQPDLIAIARGVLVQVDQRRGRCAA